MKKIVIVGAGTAGLAAAAMMKSYWKDKVDITLIYDKSRGNISVGESTTPIFRLLLGHLGVSTKAKWPNEWLTTQFIQNKNLYKNLLISIRWP